MPISSHWNRKAGSRQNLFTYTNAKEVELLVNGKSIGIQTNAISDPSQRNAIFWKNVPYTPGTITAIARSDNREVARHRLETTGDATTLRIEIENENWKADGMDLQYVKVRAVDDQSRNVLTAAGEVTFEVSGAARLIAVDNGDHASGELFGGNKRSLHKGFAMAILRANQTPGPVKIKVTSPGLKSAEKTMNAGDISLPRRGTKMH
jgi:beta-galactosidase